MGEITDDANEVYRDFNTDGVPSSGAHDPEKPDIRSLFSKIDIVVAASAAGIAIVATTADRDTFYTDADNQSKLVYVNNNNGTADDAANGVYEYVGGAPRIATGFYQGVAAVVQPLVDEAEAWAQSDANPDPEDSGSKSAKTLAAEAAASAEVLGGVFTFANDYDFPGFFTGDGRIWLYADPVSGEVDFLPSGQLKARILGTTSVVTALPKTDFSRLYMWGDSRTEGAGDATPNTFPYFAIAALPLVAVHGKSADNLGRSGQLSAEIVARQGGLPPILTVADDTIPASGAVAVTSRSVDIFKYGGSVNGSATFNSQTGYLAGIHGTYANDGAGNHSFTRTDAGLATPVPIGSVFTPDIAVAAANAVNFLCAGTNDPYASQTDIVFNTLAARQYTEANGGLMMVAGVIGRQRGSASDTNQSDIVLLNQMLKAAHGRYYLDFLTPPTAAEMAAVGYSPTSTDTADIAAGYWPTGLYDAANDYVHFQQLGQKIQVSRMVAMFNNLKAGAA